MLADFLNFLRQILLNAMRGRGVHSNRNWRLEAQPISQACGWSQEASHLSRELPALLFLVLWKQSRNSGLMAQATPESLLHRRRNRTWTFLAQDFRVLPRGRVNWLAILSFLVRWALHSQLHLACAVLSVNA